MTNFPDNQINFDLKHKRLNVSKQKEKRKS